MWAAAAQATTDRTTTRTLKLDGDNAKGPVYDTAIIDFNASATYANCHAEYRFGGSYQASGTRLSIEIDQGYANFTGCDDPKNNRSNNGLPMQSDLTDETALFSPSFDVTQTC